MRTLNPYQYYKSRENPYQVLQVTCAASERAMVRMVKIIITTVPSYARSTMSELRIRLYCYQYALKKQWTVNMAEIIALLPK